MQGEKIATKKSKQIFKKTKASCQCIKKQGEKNSFWKEMRSQKMNGMHKRYYTDEA